MAAEDLNPPIAGAPALLTIKEAAALFRLAPVTLYERVRANPQLYGRVRLGGREVRLRASAIRRLLGEPPIELDHAGTGGGEADVDG